MKSRLRRLFFPPGIPSEDPGDLPIWALFLVIVYAAMWLNSYASWLTGYYP